MVSAALVAHAQAQPGPLPAADSAKRGMDLYKAGDFAGAVAPLQDAVDLEPNNFEYRFMLAQALRQSGNCAEAMPHYKQLETSAPPDRANELMTAMGACPNAGIAPPPQTPSPPPPPAPEPVQVKSGIGGANAWLLVGAGAGIAAGLCLGYAAYSDDNDADAAASHDDYSSISARADREKIAAIVAGGAGLVLGVIAIYRIKVSKEGTQLSLRPRTGGGTLVLERSW